MQSIVVTGGVGFIGSNVAHAFLQTGARVIVFDNLGRAGVDHNLRWLKKSGGDFTFVKGDVRDEKALAKLIRKHRPDVVLHEAAQVAVTTSVLDPRTDFDTNAGGTFNVLEAVRKEDPEAIVLYASTNKVYGGLENLEVVEQATRYEFADDAVRRGVSEAQNLDFHSPYGCSKGSADQYVRDYARLYGMRTVVFRQSCIYGYRQIGLEDQGWVAWFLIRALLGKPVTIYGDGKQIRDVLFIDDLVRAYVLAIRKIRRAAGQVYNVGGGYDNAMSLLEFLSLLEKLTGKHLPYGFSDWRPGDQKIFISDNSRIEHDLGWRPRVNKEKGIRLLYAWLNENRKLFAPHA